MKMPRKEEMNLEEMVVKMIGMHIENMEILMNAFIDYNEGDLKRSELFDSIRAFEKLNQRFSQVLTLYQLKSKNAH